MRLSTALAAVFLVILVTLTDCKKKESDDTGLWMVLAAYFMNSGGALGGTKSPGDVLTGSAGTSSFTFTNESQSKTTSGQITRYTGSPFISLCPPPYTTCGFAIQVSGVGLLSAPLSGYGGSSTSNLRAEAYADLSGADCNIAQTYNIVQTAFENTQGEAAFGTATTSGSGANRFITCSLNNMNAGFNGATSYGTCGFTGPCANGRVNYSGGQTSFHNPAGVIVYDRGVGLGGFFGLKQDTAINATNALTGKTFFGFKNNAGALPNASGDNFVTAKLVCNSNNCTATNVDPRTLASSGVASVITIGGAVNGKMTASVTTGGDVFGLNDNLVLAAATINGKVIITFTECSTGGCTTTSQHAYGFFAQQ